jgi:hypothetical protein
MKTAHWVIIIIGFVLLALMATNPSIEDHRESVKEIYKKKLSEMNKGEEGDLGRQIGTGLASLIGDGLIDNIVSRENYLLFSVTMATFGSQSKKIGFGILGKVFVGDYDKIESSLSKNEGSTEKKEEFPATREGYVLGSLEVMKSDLNDEMYLPDAQELASKKGGGWRIPSMDELKILYENRFEIGAFKLDRQNYNTLYISSDEGDGSGSYREIKVLDFSNGNIGWDFYCCKGPGGNVRVVRSIKK